MSDVDETISEATQLHLFLSIIIMMLLMRFFATAPELFDQALFSCISMPATYALTYYHARAYRMGKFVVKKTPEPVRLWTYELAAMIMSYVMGYIMFLAMSGSSDCMIFSIAFATVQLMRLLIIMLTGNLRNMGVDIQHPVVVMLISLSIALVSLVVLSLFFSVFFPV